MILIAIIRGSSREGFPPDLMVRDVFDYHNAENRAENWLRFE